MSWVYRLCQRSGLMAPEVQIAVRDAAVLTGEALARFYYNVNYEEFCQRWLPGRHPNYQAEQWELFRLGHKAYWGKLDNGNKRRLIDVAVKRMEDVWEPDFAILVLGMTIEDAVDWSCEGLRVGREPPGDVPQGRGGAGHEE